MGLRKNNVMWRKNNLVPKLREKYSCSKKISSTITKHFCVWMTSLGVCMTPVGFFTPSSPEGNSHVVNSKWRSPKHFTIASLFTQRRSIKGQFDPNWFPHCNSFVVLRLMSSIFRKAWCIFNESIIGRYFQNVDKYFLVGSRPLLAVAGWRVPLPVLFLYRFHLHQSRSFRLSTPFGNSFGSILCLWMDHEGAAISRLSYRFHRSEREKKIL